MLIILDKTKTMKVKDPDYDYNDTFIQDERIFPRKEKKLNVSNRAIDNEYIKPKKKKKKFLMK